MELINREDAIRVIALERLPENSLNFCVKAYNDAIDRIQEVISQMDAIESRQKGKWLKTNEETNEIGVTTYYTCSECGNYLDSIDKLKLYKCCPYCETKMEND